VEKVAWILVRDDKILAARNDGRTLFYLPGGQREPGETDAQTLTREIWEELTVRLDPRTLTLVGSCVTQRDGRSDTFRMIAYTADYAGDLQPASEIAEIAWFGYADYDRVTPAAQHFFDQLRAARQLV